MPFLNMDKTTLVKFDILSSHNIRGLKKKWKDRIAVKNLIIFNKNLMSIQKLTRKVY